MKTPALFLLAILTCAQTSASANAPQVAASNNNSNSAEQAPTPQIEEVRLENGKATLTLPLNSKSYLASSWPKTVSTLKNALTTSYSSVCTDASYEFLTSSTELPIHRSEIPELDGMSTLMDEPLVKSAKCARPKIETNKSGFAQAKGAIRLTISPPSPSMEESDRRLVKITMPWKKTTGWGTGLSDTKLYRQSCVAHSDRTSTLMVHCSEPEMSVACCGNAGLTGQMTALVFAYANPKMNAVIHTANSPAEVNALNSNFLAKKTQELASDLAFGICTPPNWEYSPVMAYQSTCYTLTQKFQPLHPSKLTCKGQSANAGAKVWALLKHDPVGKKDYLAFTVQTDRLQSGFGVYVASIEKAESTSLESEEGVVLAVSKDKSSAKLTGLEKVDEKYPAASLSLSCQ